MTSFTFFGGSTRYNIAYLKFDVWSREAKRLLFYAERVNNVKQFMMVRVDCSREGEGELGYLLGKKKPANL